jgi:serine/threonine-protein kinase
MLRITILACFLLGGVAPVAAQPTGNQAQELYDQGRALVAAGKTAEGCDAFERSQQLEPLATTLAALAICRERLGQLATARRLFLQAEQQTRSAHDRVTAQLHQLARDKAAGLEPRVSKLTIRVPEQSKINGLEIRLGEKVVSAEAWNQVLPIDGGTYTITARASGVNDWSTRVTLGNASDSKTVDIPDLRNSKQTFDERPKAPKLPVPSQSPELPDSTDPSIPTPSSVSVAGSSSRPSRLTPILVGSAGAAAVITGSVLIAVYDPPDPEAIRRYEYYYDTRTPGIVTAIGGAIAIGVSIHLWRQQSRSAVTAVPLSRGAAVTWMTTF